MTLISPFNYYYYSYYYSYHGAAMMVDYRTGLNLRVSS